MIGRSPIGSTPIAGDSFGVPSFIDTAIVIVNLVPSALEGSGNNYTGSLVGKFEICGNFVGVYTLGVPQIIPEDTTGGQIFVPGPLPPSAVFKVIHYDHNDKAIGEEFPVDTEFAIYLGKIGYCNYDINLESELARIEKTEPDATDFKLYRGNKPIMGGEHVSTEISDVNAQMLKVSGNDWMAYLDKLFWPFNPDNPTAGGYLVTDRDLRDIVDDLLNAVLAQSNTPTFTHVNQVTGQLTNFKIEPADTESILSKITVLSQMSPGFDFEVTHDRQVKMYTPKKGVKRSLVLELGSNIYDFAYTDKGVAGTHTLGLAQTASSRVGVAMDSITMPKYRRKDISKEFSDVKDKATLTTLTTGETARNGTPSIEFSCKVVPEYIDDLLSAVGVGDTLRVVADMKYDQMDRDWRLVSIVGRPDNNKNEEYELGFDDGTLSL